MSYSDLAATFDQVASAYASARPHYPSALFNDVITITGIAADSRLLEIGCGPGTATLPLAERGYAITAVEPGPALADQARQNLVGYPKVAVVTSAFEDWAPTVRASRFDLAYAATAWHWLEPSTRFAEVARLLRPGGYLAVWSASHGFPDGYDSFFAQIQAVYDELGESRGDEWPPPPPDQVPGAEDDFATAGFSVGGVRRYVWFVDYTADGYLRLLDTFSNHIAMASAKRDHLYAEVRRLLADRPDGMVRRHWLSVLTVGRRPE